MVREETTSWKVVVAEIGIRELKAHASEILRSVREQGARYTVTYRGRPVGVLLPLPAAADLGSATEDAWEELARLGGEVERGWRAQLSSTEILSEMRR